MPTDRTTARRTTWFAVGALLVALLLAGVVSYWASSSPDGLEKVAADQGFDSTAQDHDLDGSPFAGYGTAGLDGFAGSALAGAAGVLATLAVTGGLVLMVRRRPRPEPADGDTGAAGREPADGTEER